MGAVDLHLSITLLMLSPDSSKKPKYFPTNGDAQMLSNLNLTSTPPGCTTALHLTNARSVLTQSIAASMYRSTADVPGGRVSVTGAFEAGLSCCTYTQH